MAVGQSDHQPEPNISGPDGRKPPHVLFDSYHAHNFLHRGLKEHEYSYHQYSGLRRAARLLENRGCIVDELLVGPLSDEILSGVDLFVLNLPSMDRPPMLVSEVLALENYVRGGGGILFVTDHSNCYYHQYKLLPLWKPLGLIPTFETVCVSDPESSLSKRGSGWALIRDFANHEITSGLRSIAIQTGGRVLGDGELAWTSEAAWADAGATPLYGEGDPGGLYGDWKLAASEVAGKQAIALARQVGGGRVCVIADQNCLSDAFIAYADNWKFWLNACRWTGTLQYDSPTAAPAGTLQIDCYEPLEPVADGEGSGSASQPDRQRERRFDFGADDPDQLFGFWVWMNRYHWVGCGAQESRPPETMAEKKILLVDGCRVSDRAFLARASEALHAGGSVIVLGSGDANQESGTLAPEDLVSKFRAAFIDIAGGLWQESTTDEQDVSMRTAASLPTQVFLWEPSDPSERRDLPQPRMARIIFVSDTSRLRSEYFPSPNQQPNREQQELQQWLQGLLFPR